MESIIYTICTICYAIFIVQFFLSLLEYDLDLDLDMTSDLSLSDFISFKGILHFLIGESTYLSAICISGIAISWLDYLIAILCGIIFMIILHLVYKFIFHYKKKIK